MRARGTMIATALLVLVTGTVTTGCFRRQYPERRQFVLSVDRAAPAHNATAVVIKIGRARAEPQYERKAFVYRTGEATYTDDFYNTFYVSPTQMTRSILQEWISESNLFATVADVDSLVGAEWLLESRLLDFYIDRRSPDLESAVVRLSVTVVDATRSPPRAILERAYEASEPTKSGGDDYVAAWSTALADVCVKLEADLASLLSQRRGR